MRFCIHFCSDTLRKNNYYLKYFLLIIICPFNFSVIFFYCFFNVFSSNSMIS